MGFLSALKSFLVPFYLLVGYVFICSGLIVFFLMFLTYIFVWPFNQRLYRKIVMTLAYTLWSEFTFLAQWWSDSDITVNFENHDDFLKLGTEHTIVLMNHKYDIDWLMAWVLAERYGVLGGAKIYAKTALRWIPIIGWIWVLTENIFLKRAWDKDKSIISRDLEYITNYPDDYWVTLLLFCEGTRFTEEKHKISLEIARKKGLSELKHHLIPRTRGFVHSMNGLKGKIPAILDITIAFSENYAKPTLVSILQGKKCHAEAFIRRIPLETVPTDTDEACAAWLQNLFKEKDDIYEHFVQNGTFKIGQKYHIPKRPYDMIIWLLWASFLSIPLLKVIMYIIFSGSYYLQIGTIIVLALLYKGIREMVAVSEIDKGSTYGKPNQNLNGTKKD